MSAESTPIVPTPGEISRRLGVPVHRIDYIIRTRNIRPAGRAGNAYFYEEAGVEKIASELLRIKSNKGVFQ